MAREEFIIRVKIDGMGGTSGTGGQGDNSLTAVGIARAAVSPLPTKSDISGTKLSWEERITKNVAKENYLQIKNLGIIPGSYGGAREISAIDKITGQSSILAQQTLFGKIGGAGMLQQIDEKVSPYIQTYGPALAKAAAYKAIAASINITQHRSGDTYYNQQLSNATRMSSYGAVLAMSGPAAPAVLVGIVANELVDLAVQSSNYKYDRRLEGHQIQNTKMLAGNVSYGRNRGAI